MLTTTNLQIRNPTPLRDSLFQKIFVDNLSLAAASQNEESFSRYCFEHLEQLAIVVHNEVLRYVALRVEKSDMQTYLMAMPDQSIADMLEFGCQTSLFFRDIKQKIALIEKQIKTIKNKIETSNILRKNKLEEIDCLSANEKKYSDRLAEIEKNSAIMAPAPTKKQIRRRARLDKAREKLKQFDNKVMRYRQEADVALQKLNDQLESMEGEVCLIREPISVVQLQEMMVIYNKIMRLQSISQAQDAIFFENYKLLNTALYEKSYYYSYHRFYEFNDVAEIEAEMLALVKEKLELRDDWVRKNEQIKKRIDEKKNELRMLPFIDQNQLNVEEAKHAIDQWKAKVSDDFFYFKNKRYKLLDKIARYQVLLEKSQVSRYGGDVTLSPMSYEGEALILKNSLVMLQENKKRLADSVGKIENKRFVKEKKLQTFVDQLSLIKKGIVSQNQKIIDVFLSTTWAGQCKKNEEHLNLILTTLLNFQHDGWSSSQLKNYCSLMQELGKLYQAQNKLIKGTANVHYADAQTIGFGQGNVSSSSDVLTFAEEFDGEYLVLLLLMLNAFQKDAAKLNLNFSVYTLLRDKLKLLDARIHPAPETINYYLYLFLPLSKEERSQASLAFDVIDYDLIDYAHDSPLNFIRLYQFLFESSYPTSEKEEAVHEDHFFGKMIRWLIANNNVPFSLMAVDFKLMVASCFEALASNENDDKKEQAHRYKTEAKGILLTLFPFVPRIVLNKFKQHFNSLEVWIEVFRIYSDLPATSKAVSERVEEALFVGLYELAKNIPFDAWVMNKNEDIAVVYASDLYEGSNSDAAIDRQIFALNLLKHTALKGNLRALQFFEKNAEKRHEIAILFLEIVTAEYFLDPPYYNCLDDAVRAIKKYDNSKLGDVHFNLCLAESKLMYKQPPKMGTKIAFFPPADQNGRTCLTNQTMNRKGPTQS